MLNPYDLKKLGFNSVKYIHLLTETMRCAFANRAHFLGDPDFAYIPQGELLNSTYNKQRLKSFSWDTASTSDKIGAPIKKPIHSLGRAHTFYIDGNESNTGLSIPGVAEW